MKEVRMLYASEINVKPKQLVYNNNRKEASALLLLFKDSRCDQDLMDECFGAENWQRTHREIAGKMFCTVSVWDESKKSWVCKEDVGTESDIEKEKGEVSDSFKRACTNWGVGRELYTAPKAMWVTLFDDEYSESNGKVRLRPSVRFKVSSIDYEGKAISGIVIVDGNNKERYRYGKKAASDSNGAKHTQTSQEGKKPDKRLLTMDRVRQVYNDCKGFGGERYVSEALERMSYNGMTQLHEDEVEKFMNVVAQIKMEHDKE